MATPYQIVFDAFMSKILDDEWYNWNEDETHADMRALLENAIPYFKFPRTPLDRDEEGFINDLNPTEIQILSSYMKIEWLNRCVLTWKNLKTLYSEADFSQANLIDKYIKLLNEERTNTQRLESLYYRSINGRPYGYRNLAGK